MCPGLPSQNLGERIGAQPHPSGLPSVGCRSAYLLRSQAHSVGLTPKEACRSAAQGEQELRALPVARKGVPLDFPTRLPVRPRFMHVPEAPGQWQHHESAVGIWRDLGDALRRASGVASFPQVLLRSSRNPPLELGGRGGGVSLAFDLGGVWFSGGELGVGERVQACHQRKGPTQKGGRTGEVSNSQKLDFVVPSRGVARGVTAQ